MNKVLINNKCENPVEVGTGLVFREDGTYTVSVYNGKITVYESGAPHDKTTKEEETEPYELYINACEPNKEFVGYRCNKCDRYICQLFTYCPECGRKINWKAIKNENK